MRSTVLLLAVLIAGCAQPDQRKKGDPPVVMENPPISRRIRIHEQEQDRQKAAEDTTAETTVGGMVVR